MSNLDKFGNDFQLKVFHHILSDPEFFSQVVDSLRVEYFSNENYQQLLQMILVYAEKYKAIPAYDNLETIIRTNVENDNAKNYLLDTLDAIKKIDVVTDKRFIEDKVLEFCRQQAMVVAIKDSIGYIGEEKYDKVFSTVQKALMVGTYRTVGHNFFSDVEKRTSSYRYPIPTGFLPLDSHTSGGLGRGELGIILAGVNIGKSMALIWLASQALLRGFTVVYYTLELSDILTGLRFDSCLARQNLTDLLQDAEGAYRKDIAKELARVKAQTGKDIELIIKEWPTKMASVASIRSHITNLRYKGIVPDLICIDYADLLRSASRYKDKRFELEALVEEIRGLAKETNTAIWTASQANRVGAASRILDVGVISEAFSKAMVADLIIGIGRDAHLVGQGKACYFISKNRIGKSKIAYLGDFNTDILTLSMDEIYDPDGSPSDARTNLSSHVKENNDKISKAIAEMLAMKGEKTPTDDRTIE